jgi:hypothetical protein
MAAAGWTINSSRRTSITLWKRLLRQLDFHAQELRIMDHALGRITLEHP